MTSERSRDLIAAVDHLLRVEESWLDTDEPITEEFEDAVDGCIEAFASGDLPADCRELAATIMELSDPWDAYKTEAVIQSDPAFMPSAAFWNSLKELRQLRIRRDRPVKTYLEPIDELVKQKVPPDQICRMYGFLDDRGYPDLNMLAEEKANPGTHTDRSKGWLPPQERRALERQRSRLSTLDRVQKAMKARMNRERHEATPAPEDWETLILGGTSAQQIAVMKRCEVADVLAKAEELGLPAPPITYHGQLNEAARPKGEDDSPADDPALSFNGSESDLPRTDAGDDEINQAIAQLIDAGNTDEEIKVYVEQEFGARINARRIGNVRRTLETVNDGQA